MQAYLQAVPVLGEGRVAGTMLLLVGEAYMYTVHVDVSGGVPFSLAMG